MTTCVWKTITYSDQSARVSCDGKCNKAWGINARPRAQLSDDEDDTVYLADDELDYAPADPGTYECGQGKPISNSMFPNKWCVRECERCAMSKPGESQMILWPNDFSERVYNQPWRHNK